MILVEVYDKKGQRFNVQHDMPAAAVFIINAIINLQNSEC
jgi:hypothetical protein